MMRQQREWTPVCGVLTVSMVLLLSAFDSFGQEYIREFYPYWRDEEAAAPLLQSDTALFYRALRQAPDLYTNSARYALPRIAAGRRGLPYTDRQSELNGCRIESYRTGTLLPLLGTAGTAAPAMLQAALTDRDYRFGVRGGWSGALGGGWHAAAALDLRTGRDLHVAGRFTDAVTAGVRIGRHFAEDQRIELCLALPISAVGGHAASVEEAFRLTGDRLYNPAWGYQNGRVRNARVRRERLPMGQLHAALRLTPATTLAATAGIEAGERSYSGLNWYDARTPLPDNYRYLPGYTGDPATDLAWRNNDTRYTQIDWDRMIVLNRLAEGQAVYTLEEDVERLLRLTGSLGFTTQLDAGIELRYGVAADGRQLRRFRRMRDLLGAAYVVDIDQYLVDDDTFGNQLQNNLRDPDRRIGEGDRFGYDYALREQSVEARIALHAERGQLRAAAAATLGSAVRYRQGYYEKELFPGENSYGASRRMRFAPWSAGLELGWSFSTRSQLTLRATAAAAAPDAEELFYQPRYNNRTVETPRTEQRMEADLSWRLTGRRVVWQTSLFVQSVRGIGYTNRYYDDWSGAYADVAVRDLGIGAVGLESAVEWQPGRRWSVTATAAFVRSRYTHNPTLTVLADADNRVIDAEAVSYLGACRPGRVPTGSASAQVRYFGPSGWGFRLSGGYAGGRYAEPEPLRRTQRIARQAGSTPESFAAFVKQERLSDAFTLDAALFKSFRFGRSGQLTLSLAMRNLTDDASVYNAWESPRIQHRYAGDLRYWEPPASRRTYVYPRSFYLSAACRF